MILILIIFIISISSVNAIDSDSQSNQSFTGTDEILLDLIDETGLNDKSYDLENRINDANDGDEILIEPGTYYINNLTLKKNLTIQGKGNPQDIIIDGEQKSSIFLIRSDAVHATFKNITFINANVVGFGGAISMETGNVYVDNCIFANNTASVNAGGISNYGTEYSRGYLLVNNSLFINNHGNHDGGAITTCFADSYIYNTVFINNSAHRDGGAIRVSVEGYGNVEDCIFMYNHADEWGGAYYSWSGTSKIERCIFLNNTAGTNGGAVMVSGNIELANSIIMNNNGGETGGSFYIQQPMYDAATTINVHDNLITNNTSPYGKEIFIKWDDTKHLFTKFNNNDWGDEDPNDPSVIDPDQVTPRSKVTSTIKSNLLNILNLGLLTKYANLLEDYFPEGYLDNIQNEPTENNNQRNIDPSYNSEDSKTFDDEIPQNKIESANNNEHSNDNSDNATSQNVDKNPNTLNENINSNIVAGNSTTHGNKEKAYELNENNSVKKQSSLDYRIFIAGILIVFILLVIGYKRQKRISK